MSEIFYSTPGHRTDLLGYMGKDFAGLQCPYISYKIPIFQKMPYIPYIFVQNSPFYKPYKLE